MFQITLKQLPCDVINVRDVSDEVDNISKVLTNYINTDNISNKRRPSVVVNRYPERQHDFTNNRQNLNGSTTYRKKINKGFM